MTTLRFEGLLLGSKQSASSPLSWTTTGQFLPNDVPTRTLDTDPYLLYHYTFDTSDHDRLVMNNATKQYDAQKCSINNYLGTSCTYPTTTSSTYKRGSGCLRLDSTYAQYVQLYNNLNIPANGFTVSFWFNPITLTTNTRLFHCSHYNGTSYALRVDIVSNVLVLTDSYSTGSSYTNTLTLTTNTWYHAVWVWSAA